MKALGASMRQGFYRLLHRVDWKQRGVNDAAVIVVFALIAYGVSEWFDLFDRIVNLQKSYGDWGLDDIVLICVALSVALTAYAWRRFQDLTKENRARRSAEAEVRNKVQQLTRAQAFLTTIVENVPVTIFVRELPECRFVLVNREAEKLLGISREELLGRTVSDVFPGPAARRIEDHDQIQLRSHGPTLFDEVPVSTRGSDAENHGRDRPCDTR